MEANGCLLPAPAAAHKIYKGPISGTFKTHKKSCNFLSNAWIDLKFLHIILKGATSFAASFGL